MREEAVKKRQEEPTLEEDKRRFGDSDTSDKDFYIVKILEPPSLGTSPSYTTYLLYN